jgi:COP9 signalosome complex subunit 12
MKLENYFSQLELHLKNRAALEISSLLSVSFLPKSLKTAFLANKTFTRSKTKLEESWYNLFHTHLQAAVAFSEQQHSAAFKYQSETVLIMQRFFTDSDSWILPIVHTTSEDLWKCAFASSEPALQEEASRLINRSFNISINDRSGKDDSSSRKMGAYRLVNLLFKVYLYLDQLNLCYNLLKVLFNTQLPNIQLFPKAHLCTFYYFHGQFLLISAKFREAEAELSKSLRICHCKHKNNQKLILELLIPLRVLIYGQKPNLTTLPPGLLYSYVPKLLDLIFLGQYKEYFEELKLHQSLLYRTGSMFAWERMGLLIRRNFFFRIFNHTQKNTRLPIHVFSYNPETKSFPPESIGHTTSIFVGLINLGLIKAYIHLERLYIVFSAKDPFPRGVPVAYI